MNKATVRQLKSHYLDRWAVMKHNARNQDKILLVEDAYVIRNLNPGRTLILNCLGEMFVGLVDQLTVQQPSGLYQNIVMINNIEFKYLNTTELYDKIKSVADQYLDPDGQMFCTCNHRYLKYDRVNQPVELAFDSWQQKKLKLTKLQVMMRKSRVSFGDIWLTLAYD
jgi:hypothetical protein